MFTPSFCAFYFYVNVLCAFLACPCCCYVTLAIPTFAPFRPNCFISLGLLFSLPFLLFSLLRPFFPSSPLRRQPNIRTHIAYRRCPLARLHTLLNRMRTALDPSRYAIHTLPICGSCHSDASQGPAAAASRHWAGFRTGHPLESMYTTDLGFFFFDSLLLLFFFCPLNKSYSPSPYLPYPSRLRIHHTMLSTFSAVLHMAGEPPPLAACILPHLTARHQTPTAR